MTIISVFLWDIKIYRVVEFFGILCFAHPMVIYRSIHFLVISNEANEISAFKMENLSY